MSLTESWLIKSLLKYLIADCTAIAQRISCTQHSDVSSAQSLNNKTLQRLEEHRKTYETGVDKFNNEFDWVKIIHSLRRIKAAVKTMLDDRQKTLNAMNKENLIEFNEVSCFDLVKSNQENNLNPKFLMLPRDDWSPNAQRNFENTVNRFMDLYSQRELTKIDAKLLNGVF